MATVELIKPPHYVDTRGPPYSIVKEMQTASVSTLLRSAAEVVKERQSESPLLSESSKLERLPNFSANEVVLGRVLGRGGFCEVLDIDKIRGPAGVGRSASSISRGGKSTKSFFSRLRFGRSSNKGNELTRKESATQASSVVGSEGEVAFDFSMSRDFMISHSREKKYVLKRVTQELIRDDKITFLKGTVDLAMEASFLSSLSHKNVITLAGTSDVGVSHQNYFIILERLEETLSKRLKTWMNKDRTNKGVTGAFLGNKRSVENLYNERINAAIDIADAMAYLHSKNVIYRDLKPDNIGFARSGTLKLFDFGVAKHVLPKDQDENGLYLLTGLTGAFRYMAPEVGLGKPYNLKADVYSFSMLLWYMLSLEPPFPFFTPNMMIDRVFKKGTRPAVFRSWSTVLGNVMRSSWDATIDNRPSFREIAATLREGEQA